MVIPYSVICFTCKVYSLLFLSMLTGREVLQVRIRENIISFSLTIGLVAIIGRLFVIQISSPHSFSSTEQDLIKNAERIQQREMVLDTGRGMIVDRVGQPLVGGENLSLLVFPQSSQQISLREEKFAQLAKLIQYPYHEFIQKLTQLTKPTIITNVNGRRPLLQPHIKDKIEALQIPGIFVVKSDHRNIDHPLAMQIIGQVGRSSSHTKKIDTYKKNVGLTGIEATFDSFLEGETKRVLSYITDGRGKALIGKEVRLKEHSTHRPSSHVVVTTLDRNIQERVEQILTDYKVEEGAIVVQEIKTGDIVAVGSRPNKFIEESEQNPWDNRALMEATPGSIFKTVVAMAALEEGIVKADTVFECDGHLESYKLKDHDPKGHGKITFAEAYAKSCNIVFGQVAKKLGGEKLESYAKRLGLNQRIIWTGSLAKGKEDFRQLANEHRGIIFSEEQLKKDHGAAVQTGIGQRDVKLTPLQAANMVTSLFHKGKPLSPRIVTEVQTKDGKVIQRFTNKYLPEAQAFKASTITEMQKMMRMVVKKGTAVSLMQAKWSLAGKTGTAQVGENNQYYHKWMIGYGPFTHPRYSIAVLIRSVEDADDPRAREIFQAVMDHIFLLEEGKGKQ
jgi:cell division protein FtsI/penicillin-binding protein 2